MSIDQSGQGARIMSSLPDNTRGSSRRTFLLGGASVGLAAGTVIGWLAAHRLPYLLLGDPVPSTPEKSPPSGYANFARVTSTAEEVIIDFCLNSNPFAEGRQEIKVSQRLIMNFPTAKQLFLALGTTVQEHENAHGLIELDIRKRAKRGR
jgi:hypothetical protein